MTDSQYRLFLSVGMWICAVGALLNLIKLKRRGNTAFVLSAAFLTMGGLLWLVRSGASQMLVTGGSVLLLALLVLDFVLRSRHQDKPQ